jgi:GntR family transcriptional regulator
MSNSNEIALQMYYKCAKMYYTDRGDDFVNLILGDKKPLYSKIRDDLKQKIDNGYWKEGDLIPPETELAKTYGISRVTIRKSISQLVEENYLVRTAGYGTTVLKTKPNQSIFTMIQSNTNEMREMGLPCTTISAELEMIKADQYLAKIFSINVGDDLYNLRRVRGAKVPILYSDTYLLPIIKIPDKKDVLFGSLYEFLAGHNIFFNKFEENVKAVKQTKRIMSLLRVDEMTPILRRDRYAYDDYNQLIEYTKNFYNSNLYEYRTRIIYRKK